MLIVLIVIAIILVSVDIILTLIRMKPTKKTVEQTEQVTDKPKWEIKKFKLSVEATEDMTRKQISDALLKQAIEIFKEHTYIEVHNNVYTCEFSLYCEGEQDE